MRGISTYITTMLILILLVLQQGFECILGVITLNMILLSILIPSQWRSCFLWGRGQLALPERTDDAKETLLHKIPWCLLSWCSLINHLLRQTVNASISPALYWHDCIIERDVVHISRSIQKIDIPTPGQMRLQCSHKGQGSFELQKCGNTWIKLMAVFCTLSSG